MLEIKCDDYYKKVVDFAEKKGLKKQLEQRLDYLRKYADHDEKGLCVVELHKDFSPASFSLLWKRGGEVWMNGALVFHGNQEGWGNEFYVDPLSVQLVADPENPWSIHT